MNYFLSITFFILLILLFSFNGCFKEHIYSTVTLWNQDKSRNIKFITYSISWNDVGYRILYENKKILNFRDTGVFARWVSNDSLLFVSNSKSTTKNISDLDIKIELADINSYPWGSDKKLIRLNDHLADKVYYSNNN